MPHRSHSPSDVKHDDIDSTAVACSVQQHYSKQTGRRKDICAQETTMRLDSSETLAHPLRLWKLERTIQTVPATSGLWSHSGSNSSLQSTSSLDRVSGCHSPLGRSDYQAMRSLQLQPGQCTLPLAGDHTDELIDDNCPVDEAHEVTPHSLEYLEDRQQTSHSQSVQDLSEHFRSGEEDLTAVHDPHKQTSVCTRATQTVFCGELQDSQLVSIKADKLAQSLLTLEARLTLTETRLKILEERQNDVT